MCEICSKLTIKTPKQRQWGRFGVFIVNFEIISHLCSSVSIVNFEYVIAGWDSHFGEVFGVKTRTFGSSLSLKDSICIQVWKSLPTL